MQPRKICVVTGTRAEYGLLYWLLKRLQDDNAFELQIVATGAHLSPEFGLTYKTIENDGFTVDAKVEMLLSSDTAVGITKSIGLGVIGFADAFDRLKPDILLLLGDRFETLAAAQAALIARIPIAHIAGGDTTEGAYDEAIRHSITKMSHLHFVTNSDAERRVRQLGENPQHIYNTGSPGLDNITRLQLLDRSAFEESINFKLRPQNLLITFHPVTLETQTAATQFQELLDALDELGPEIGCIITKPNADSDGRVLISMIDEFATGREHVSVHTSLGQVRYLSAINHVDAVVGNSSSGLYEVPTFKKPTVNIGDRQKGRQQASSVINCDATRTEIVRAVRAAFDLNCTAAVNPYGDGESSSRIIETLRTLPEPLILLKKHFYDI